ncbi:hypothetical protein SAMN05421837_101171 [Amycolatopsis pretoriensis]|uniref:NAD-dependent epimerase/dehydratase domain-containing protein n=1 Tax=Amycolatopsis pretoriensis TaxID=218821 RepID=A0A1H5Q1J8_9PSEU|nr:NAD-dependent epimerase/dehydratase family protein [Amycolatopsis pretoriensis]SEF19960.1 hypothetical protein SAMN05421837_101171 [Amycolatopsis pretoriensis]
MKIAVVGAAGMVGSRVLSEAARRGHDLLAVLRARRPAVQLAGFVLALAALVAGQLSGPSVRKGQSR